MSRFLLEIGTEAIPAGYIPPALSVLGERMASELEERRLRPQSIDVRGTAKRLVLEVEGLPDRQEDRVLEVQGPRVDIAYKDGKPSRAAEGFARKNGVAVEDLERVSNENGEFVLARVQEIGQSAGEVLVECVPGIIEGLSWPKTMTWNATRFRFPRPIRWIVSILDDAVLPLEIAGIAAGNTTRGHRLLGPETAPVSAAGDLEEVLEASGVILDPELRRARIVKGLLDRARDLGGRPLEDDRLLDEVVYLAEHPQVYSGRFDTEFLGLPREVVVTAMRSHQRYFAVEGDDGQLLPHFLVVADGMWKNPSHVITGNEKVLRARLADARFYWDVDLKSGLDALAKSLNSITWLESVGTLGEKSARVTRLVEQLGAAWFPDDWTSIQGDVLRAAKLAKADLASEMIKDGKEFTGLQGIIGARYAEAEGESADLCRILTEQYLPRGAGDPLPQTAGGVAISFADRLDTVAGCFSAGFVPSGSQDPYALRRAANGMIRILLEKELHASLASLVDDAIDGLPETARPEGLAGEILEFLEDRLGFFLGERGISYDVADAVLSAGADDPLEAWKRAEAIHAIRQDERLERLVVGFKRAANILKGVDEAGLPDAGKLDWSRTQPAEQALQQSILRAGEALKAARAIKDYPAMVEHLLELRNPIDVFFDDVMVMSEIEEERSRRLALLAEARRLFHDFFDPARIVIEGE